MENQRTEPQIDGATIELMQRVAELRELLKNVQRPHTQTPEIKTADEALAQLERLLALQNNQ